MHGSLNVKNIRTSCILASLVSKRNESERKRKQYANGKIPEQCYCEQEEEESGAHCVQNSAAVKVK